MEEEIQSSKVYIKDFDNPNNGRQIFCQKWVSFT